MRSAQKIYKNTHERKKNKQHKQNVQLRNGSRKINSHNVNEVKLKKKTKDAEKPKTFAPKIERHWTKRSEREKEIFVRK